MAIPVIVINDRCDGLKLVGMAKRAISLLAFSAPDIVKVPPQIPQYDQIEQPVAVQVNPCRTRGPAAPGDASFVGNISKSAVTVVVIKLVSSICSYIQIFVAIVVIITDRDSHSIAGALQPGFVGDILERTIGLLVVQTIPIFRSSLFGNCARSSGIIDFSAVHEKEIETAIVVVIEQSDSRTHGLEKVFL